MISPAIATGPRLADLPDDVLQVVLTHLSARPRSTTWQGAVPASTLLAVLRAGGPLAAAARSAFPSVALVPEGRSPAGAVAASSAGDLDALAALLGPSLRALHLSYRAREWLCPRQLAAACGGLRALSVADEFGDLDLAPLLRAAGDGLAALSLEGYILPRLHSAAAAAHCRRLRSLSLTYNVAGGPLRALWAAAGGTLSALTLRGPFLARGMYPDAAADAVAEVGALCRGVAALRLEGLGCADVVRLARALAGPLQALRFVDAGACPPARTLAALRAAAPRARIDAAVERDVAGTLAALGGAARALHLRAARADGVAAAAAGLGGVGEVSVRAGRGYECELAPFLDALFAAPKEKLRRLSVPEGACAPRVLEVLADRVKSVEEFDCAVRRVPAQPLVMFVRANPRLRRLRVQRVRDFGAQAGGRGRGAAEDDACAVVAAAEHAPALRELVLDDGALAEVSQRVLDKCGGLRKRGVEVVVGGVQYV